jgi:hypothetical protein
MKGRQQQLLLADVGRGQGHLLFGTEPQKLFLASRPPGLAWHAFTSGEARSLLRRKTPGDQANGCRR